jgi:hypothetical protein
MKPEPAAAPAGGRIMAIQGVTAHKRPPLLSWVVSRLRVGTMQAHHLLLMVVLTRLVVASSPAVAQEKPRQTKGTEQLTTGCDKQAAQDKDRQELAKRLKAEFLARCNKDDRLYKQMVKANPHDVRAWQLLAWNTAYNLAVTSRDLKEQYAFVKRGIEQLVEGVVQNPKNGAQ